MPIISESISLYAANVIETKRNITLKNKASGPNSRTGEAVGSTQGRSRSIITLLVAIYNQYQWKDWGSFMCIYYFL